MAEKVEFICQGCSRKYRLRGTPEEIREELLFCPQCGGKLVPFGSKPPVQETSSTERDPLADLLITGPVALIFWDLPYTRDLVEEVLTKEGYTVRVFENEEELKYWLRLFVPEVVVIGTEDEDRVKLFEERLLELPMEDYRRIFRIRISPRYRTLDPREIFLTGVHLVCHPEDLERFADIYQKARDYWKVLYSPYFKAQEAMEEGRLT